MTAQATEEVRAPVRPLGTAWRWRFLVAMIGLATGLVMLTSSAFWAGVFFIIGGSLLAWSRAWWLVAVLAAFYPGHYQIVQDFVGDEGPFVMHNWMAAGFLCGLTILGAGLFELVRERPQDVTTRRYLAAVSVLIVLSILTFGPRSFQAEPSPFEYYREWIITAAVAAALALVRRFPLRVFLWTSLAMAYLDLLTVPAYRDTGYGTNLSYVLSMGVFAALLLFADRIRIGLLLAAPLLVAMALVPKQGPLLGTAAGVAVLWIGRARDTTGRRNRLLALIATIGAGALVVFVTGWWNSLWHMLRETGMNVRLRLYGEVFDRFLQSPLFGQWQISPPVPRPPEFYANRLALPSYPHAAALEVLLSWGLLGLMLWLFCQYLVLRPAWRIGLLGPWLAGFIFAQSSGDLSGNYLYWVLGAIAIALSANAAAGLRSPT